MTKGIVQFFLLDKGYGYIRVPETKEEFYVHRKHLLEPIKKGDTVIFDLKEDKQGIYATKVKVLKSTS